MRNKQRDYSFLKEITTSEKRIPALCELYTRLYEQGYHRIDYVVSEPERRIYICVG